MQHDQHMADTPQSNPYNTNATVSQLLNDPNVVYNPYGQYGVKMSWAQKQKLKRQIRLQMQSKSWFQDKYQFVLVQRNFLAVITFCCLLGVLGSVYAVKKLAPLKSVEPFIIQIEERSGITQIVEPLERRNMTVEAAEALDNYFLWAYVRARETYHPADQRRNWDITRIMSSPDVFSGYIQDISPNNPRSARAILGGVGTRKLSDPTVTYLNNPERKVAQVRFVIEETFKKVKTTYPKIATIEYTFDAELELNRSERLINPLGFHVLSYRLDEEVVR